MSEDKNKIKLHSWDWDKKERVDEGEVSVNQIARCMSHPNFVELFDSFLNYGGKEFREGKAVGEDLRTHHRTLQRSAICFAIGVLVGISQQEFSDARNKTALETAKKIYEMFDNGELPLGPYV